LGISIAGGVGSPLGDVPIFIAMMHPNGVAAQTQKLRVSSTKSLVALANLPIGFISPLHLANCCKQFEMSLSAFKSANLAATGVALSKK